MKNDLILSLFVLLFIAPYLLLFYKKENIRIRLLFVSMIEIFLFCALVTIDFIGNLITVDFSGNEILVGVMFVYGLFVWMGVFLNLILILLSWLLKKISPGIHKP
jgi:predicted membrane-bound mannosyltransferase